jgi:DNA repair protein RecO (recombination protein O)
LPAFLLAGGPPGGPQDIADGLKLTGYFLERNVYRHMDRGLPPARARLAERLKP